jgi:hypothetical protein
MIGTSTGECLNCGAQLSKDELCRDECDECLKLRGKKEQRDER